MNLEEYFSGVWKQAPDSKYKLTGMDLLNKIHPGETVLDVGCGYNQFKSHFGERLLGIDPYNDCADLKVAIEDLDWLDEEFDVGLALGSINFGNELRIRIQVTNFVDQIKPGGRIYWRQNPGIADHPFEGVKDIDFFHWTFAKNIQMADDNGCEVVHLEWDTGNRIYAEWRKGYELSSNLNTEEYT